MVVNSRKGVSYQGNTKPTELKEREHEGIYGLTQKNEGR